MTDPTAVLDLDCLGPGGCKTTRDACASTPCNATAAAYDAVVLSVPGSTTAMARVLSDIVEERVAQEEKWGQQNHPNGTGGEPGIEPFGYADAADMAAALAFPDRMSLADFTRERCESMFGSGSGTYEAILTEEWGEALSEPDPVKLRAELIQVAAVAVAWVEKLDRLAGS